MDHPEIDQTSTALPTSPADESDEELRCHVEQHTTWGTAPLVPEIKLRLLSDNSPLWQSFTAPAEATFPRPYWAFAWSGGQALARYVVDRPEQFQNRRVLDFATGCGISAIACRLAGADAITAADIAPLAIAATALNAAANHVAVDATCDDLLYCENRGWDVILAGDIWYDGRLSRHALSWLRSMVQQGVTVLSADPERPFAPMQGTAEVARYRARSVPDVDHPLVQEVRVFRLV